MFLFSDFFSLPLHKFRWRVKWARMLTTDLLQDSCHGLMTKISTLITNTWITSMIWRVIESDLVQTSFSLLLEFFCHSDLISESCCTITNLGHLCAGLSSHGVGIAFDSKFPLKDPQGHTIECIYEGMVIVRHTRLNSSSLLPCWSYV